MSDPTPPPLPENWDRCRAYMERKRRYCRQRPVDGQTFCGNHQHLLQTDSTSTGRKRVPCPLDPSHSIYEDMLEKHLQVCPQGRKRKRLLEEPYYSENVNTGGCGSLGDRETSNVGNIVPTLKKEWAQRLALRVLQVHQSIFTGQPLQKEVRDLTWEDIHNALPLVDLSQPEMDGGIEHGFHSHHIKSGGARHIPQLASLIGHLRSMNVLKALPTKKIGDSTETTPAGSDLAIPNGDLSSRPLVLIDMGAGRGMLGLASAGVATASQTSSKVHLIMVERTGSRSKADKAFRNIPKDADTSFLNLQNVQWSRCACDLAHVDLPVLLQAEECNQARIVVVAKHLCGAGTDLALKSVASIRDRVDACLFATCCHGVCDWHHYVGRDPLKAVMESDDLEGEKLNFGAAEFDLLRSWCAASVSSAHDNERSETEHGAEQKATTTKCKDNEDMGYPSCVPETNGTETHATNIASIVRDLGLCCGIQGLGRACKQLIDYGRSEYLRKEILKETKDDSSTKLCHYVPPSVSPENTQLSGCNTI